MIKSIFPLVFMIAQVSAIACPGGALTLTDVAVLRGNGISEYGKLTESLELIDKYPELSVQYGTKTKKIAIHNSRSKKVYDAEIWEVKGDLKLRGQHTYISTSYAIYSPGGNFLRFVTVKTNYHGDGVLMRSRPSSSAASEIEYQGNEVIIGCNATSISEI